MTYRERQRLAQVQQPQVPGGELGTSLSSSRPMRSADALVTVTAVARDHLAEGPSRGPLPTAFGQRQWLAIAVLAVCTALVTLALAAGPAPHERGQRMLLAFVACGPIALLRRWPLPALAAAAVANALVMAAGNAPLGFGIMLGLASYLAGSVSARSPGSER